MFKSSDFLSIFREPPPQDCERSLGKIVSVISGAKSEGKTSLMIALSLYAQCHDQKVLCIAGDQFTVESHGLFGISLKKNQGLEDVLQGNIPLHQGIHASCYGVDCMAFSDSGKKKMLWTSDKAYFFLQNLEFFRHQYDFIVIDTSSISVDLIYLFLRITDFVYCISIFSYISLREVLKYISFLEEMKQGQRFYWAVNKVSENFIEEDLNYLKRSAMPLSISGKIFPYFVETRGKKIYDLMYAYLQEE